MSEKVEEQIAVAERALGHRFPADYRWFLVTENGFEGPLGKAWVALWDVTTVAEVPSWTEGTGYNENHPGLLIIGSDGAGERIGFDMRQDPPPIVLVT